jgi:hypothetical protein
VYIINVDNKTSKENVRKEITRKKKRQARHWVEPFPIYVSASLMGSLYRDPWQVRTIQRSWVRTFVYTI